MKLCRVTSEFSYGDWIIHKFAVKADGTPVHSRSDFRDWFYFKADQIGQLSPFDKIDIDVETVYKSIYGEDCYRVTYTSIKEKNKIAKAFPNYVYETDVKPEFKWLMQTKNAQWADAKHRNIGYFDIETYTDSDVFSGPDNPFAPITSIQIYTTRQKRYFIFTWHETETEHLTTPEIKNKGNKTYVFCKDEVDVLLSFFEFMREYQVDVLAGWYSAGFDLPYIVERCNRLNIDPSALSPINRVTHYKKGFEWKTYIEGVDHVDMMAALKEIGYNLPNNKLATAAVEILKNPDIEKLTEVTWKDWKDNYLGFMRYGFRDVEILKEIDETLGIFDLFCTVQQITNITQLNDLSFKSSVVDKFIMSDCRGKYVFPTRVTVDKQKYKGATVLDPNPGLYMDVGVVDYASLYPTSVMSFNLSPETFICSLTQCEDMGIKIEKVIERLEKKGIKYVDTGYDEDLLGKRYLFYAQESKLGVLPHVLKKMYEERRRLKRQMKEVKNTDPVLYNAYDKQQYALKIILNSAYGAFGFNYFRLYKVEVADAITYFARRALDFVLEDLKSNGFNPIYGDTDSCFFVHDKKPVDNWLNGFNTSLKSSFIPRYNNGPLDDYMMMELEYEKDMERIYFGDSKKRYYGIIRNVPDGKNNKYIRGMNIIRKDTPPFLKTKMNDITECALMGTLTLDMLLNLRRDVESQPYQAIAVTKAFGKPFSQFKVKANHVEGAKFANTILGTKITHKDTPLLFPIVSHCEDDLKKTERHDSICLLPEDLHFIDERKDLFSIDYNTYFAKQVIDQLKEFKYIPLVAEVLDQYKETLK